ncbi:hypothetical protein AAW51_5247 [Caldimonas brevitalea]|uniref:Uncharacterized protein n=1 Tax=Caldimonas brevitalea TaxID=413882 RepID=A0A0G3BV79_9BURK|nr:hypothetical protein AAW51_5247 [Caldimonas brevitalea]
MALDLLERTDFILDLFIVMNSAQDTVSHAQTMTPRVLALLWSNLMC